MKVSVPRNVVLGSLPHLPYAGLPWLRAETGAWQRSLRGGRNGTSPTRATEVAIGTSRGTVRGILHPVGAARGALVAVGGSRGGPHGPAWIYEELCARLQADGLAGLRLDYRRPNNLEECVHDVLAGIALLEREGVGRVVLVGWSFGGAVVITAGAMAERVVGVATVGSQTYGTQAVSRLAPRSLLLLHGTADPILPDRCSRELYARAGEPKELVLYPGGGHGLERHARAMLEKLLAWSNVLLWRGRSGCRRLGAPACPACTRSAPTPRQSRRELARDGGQLTSRNSQRRRRPGTS